MAPAKRKDLLAVAVAPATPHALVAQHEKSYNAKLGQIVARVLDQPKFKNLRAADPVDPSKGGCDLPFDKDLYKKAMFGNSSSNFYKCAGNVGWINEMYNPIHGVPLNMSLVQTLADHSYRDCFHIGSLSFDVVSEGPAYLPMSHKGALKLAGPPEPLHALWLAVDRDLSKPDVDDAVVKRWLHVMKTVAFVFYPLADDLATHYHQETQRERMITAGAAVTHSALQKVMKIVNFKEKLERAKGSQLTSEHVYLAYREKVVLSPKSEDVSESYVKSAIDVYEKAFAVPGILDLVVDCEGTHCGDGDTGRQTGGVANPIDVHMQARAS